MPPPAPKLTLSQRGKNGKSQEGRKVENKKKMGRPTDNPRPNKLSIRISDTDKETLEKYCVEKEVNRTEAISRGIQKLKEDIEE